MPANAAIINNSNQIKFDTRYANVLGVPTGHHQGEKIHNRKRN